MVKLNIRHEAFCREYHKNGFNGLQAYKTVYGGTDKTCVASSARLLTNVNVQAFLQGLKDKANKKYDVTLETIVKELTEIQALAKQAIHGKTGSDYDLNNWIKTQQEMIKLFGLYAPVKQEVDTKITEYKFQTNLNDKDN